VSHLGIKTLLVEPGYFRTELLSSQNSAFVETSIPDYRALTEATFAQFRATHGQQLGGSGQGRGADY
jgi:hypothetical protein